MFTAFDHEDSALDEEITRVYSQLTTFSAEDKEYQQAVDQLSKLYKLRHDTAQLHLQAQKDSAAHQLECDKHADADELARADQAAKAELDGKSWLSRIEPSTVVTVAGNLAIALIVIKYEERAVISTKMLSFMKKF